MNNALYKIIKRNIGLYIEARRCLHYTQSLVSENLMMRMKNEVNTKTSSYYRILGTI